MKRENHFMLFGLDAKEKSFRGVFLFLGVYIGASLLACVLTPPIFWFFQSIYENQPDHWLMRKRVDVFYDRIRWVPIVLSLPFLFKACGLFSLSNLGLKFSKENSFKFLRYFAFGAAVAIVIFISQAIFAQVEFTPLKKDIGDGVFDFLKELIFSWILGALAVSFLEEIVFRGLMLRCFYTASNALFAILFTSSFFAYKHFTMPRNFWAQSAEQGLVAHWYTGFQVAWYDTIGIYYSWDAIQFFALLIFSAMLSLFYFCSRNLWGAVGFHAGIVFLIFIYRHNFTQHLSAKQEMFLGSANPSNGLLGIAILSLISIVYLYIYISRKPKNLDGNL